MLLAVLVGTVFCQTRAGQIGWMQPDRSCVCKIPLIRKKDENLENFLDLLGRNAREVNSIIWRFLGLCLSVVVKVVLNVETLCILVLIFRRFRQPTDCDS